MTDNELLASIREQVQEISDFVLGAYDAIEGYAVFQPVSDILPIIRPADTNSVRVVVVNGGAANPVYVREDNNIVAVVPPDTSVTLPTAGKGEITLSCAEGEDSTVAIATFKNTD